MEMYKKSFKIKKRGSKGYYRIDVEVKIDKKICEDWEYLEEKEMIVLRIVGDVYYSETGRGKPKYIGGGQCYDEIKNLKGFYIPRKLSRLLDIWESYHMNDFQAGTKEQTKVLQKVGIIKYDKAVEYLKSIDLLIDKGYLHGTGWLCKPIPDHVMLELKSIIEV